MRFDFKTYLGKHINDSEIKAYDEKIRNIKNMFNSNLSYWLKTESFIDETEIDRILNVATNIKENSDVLVVIGIGGSYMGAKAVIEALLPMYNKPKPEIIFLGTNLSSGEYYETLEYIKDKNISVNVISKSGTTLEPSIAFNLIMELMEQKYSNEELLKRIIITTDEEKGTLRSLVNEKGYTSFVVPRMIGGRYSVLTPVGLLPIAVAGIDIRKLLNGIITAQNYEEQIYEYAIIRDILYKKNKLVESYTIYNNKLIYFSEWLKQLYGETQGKEGKGLLPISNINTRDLHSLGQFLQEGTDIIFETVIGIEEDKDIILNNYNMTLNELNNIALKQVALAHSNGYTPSNIILISKLDEENLGELIQFFQLNAIIGALLLEVNPFDQPGVEEYKKLINKELNNQS
jgi:Glucose-6-phosphate isomerase